MFTDAPRNLSFFEGLPYLNREINTAAIISFISVIFNLTTCTKTYLCTNNVVSVPGGFHSCAAWFGRRAADTDGGGTGIGIQFGDAAIACVLRHAHVLSLSEQQSTKAAAKPVSLQKNPTGMSQVAPPVWRVCCLRTASSRHRR